MIATIDPGITGTGITIWKGRTRPRDNPIACHEINYASKQTDWIKRGVHVVGLVQDYLSTYNITYVYCEYQMAFEASAKGRAAQRRGDITKLTFFTGMLYYELSEVNGIPFELILPYVWMGQIPEIALRARIVDKIGLDLYEELGVSKHTMDSVGIGLHLQGRLTER